MNEEGRGVDTMQRVIFIRHGETTGDVEGRYGGAYDDALSPLGERQVAGLGEELRGRGVRRILSSPLLRARQTAAVLGEVCGCLPEVNDHLRERNQYGRLSGMVKAEALALFPADVAALKDRYFTLPGAESYEGFVAQIRAGFEDILACPEDCVAVVWHGGGMRVLFREILGLGELEHVGDCGWVELVQNGQNSEVGQMMRMARAE